MTFQQLTYVVEISACGSINKAAQKLFLSQSGLSVAVRELEKELGFRIFYRSNRGVSFTPEGREFLGYATSLMEQKQHIENMYSEHRSQAASVHLSVSTQRFPFAEDAFLKLLQSFHPEKHQFSYKETGMDAVIDDVYDHRADIGLIFLSQLTSRIITHMLGTRELAFHELASVCPSIYVRNGHPLASRSSVEESDLAEFPYVCFERPQGTAIDFSEEVQTNFLRRPERTITVNSRSSIMHVLQRTNAFTTGSGLLTQNLSSRNVLSIPLKNADELHIGWIYPRNMKMTPLVEKYTDLVENAIQESIRYTESIRFRKKEEPMS